MPDEGPNFSPFAWGALRKVTRAEAALESQVARWLASRAPTSAKVSALIGAPPSPPGSSPFVHVYVHVHVDVDERRSADPNAAFAEVRVDGHSAFASAPSTFVREVAQRLLGGPVELATPRPLTAAENSIFALVVAAALEDAGLRGEVWPVVDADDARRRFDALGTRLELSVSFGERGGSRAQRAVSIVVGLPPQLRVANPPHAAWPSWQFDLPIVVGACLLSREDLARLRVRDVIVVERCLTLRVGPGDIRLEAKPGAVEARVMNGYVPRAMATAEDAQLELTVQLGTTRLTLRQLADLAPGAIVSLGRPLSGPFEVRAQGRLIGQGELVDVDGELGVRIVTLQE